ARLAFAHPGDDVAVDRQLDDAIVGLDAVVVPLALALAMILGRQTARPAVGVRPIRDARRAVDAKEIALTGRGDFALLVLVGVVDEHLHFDAAPVAASDSGQRIAPDEKAAIADSTRLGRNVLPLEVRD